MRKRFHFRPYSHAMNRLSWIHSGPCNPSFTNPKDSHEYETTQLLSQKLFSVRLNHINSMAKSNVPEHISSPSSLQSIVKPLHAVRERKKNKITFLDLEKKRHSPRNNYEHVFARGLPSLIALGLSAGAIN